VRAVRDAKGDLIGLEGSFSDISDRKHAEKTLNKHRENLEDLVRARTGELEIANKDLESQTVELAIAKERADEANAAKSSFLANMSHEIRTPINVVIGLTNVLTKSELTDSQRGYLNKVKIASHNLLEVINDILDFSKVEAGHLEIEAAPFDLVLLFEQLADLFSNRVMQDDLELIYAISPQAPRWLTGDAGRLIQVMTNLIENAIKFTETGEIVVSVEPDLQADQRTGQMTLKFQVTDNGVGIDADVLPTLFDPFIQADSSLTRKHFGTGLGLSISKRLVELMDGTIEAHSTPGKGSRFVFTAKLMVREEEIAGASLSENLLGLKALVVDDSAAARRVMVDMLESFGFKAAAVNSGEKAIEELGRAKEDPYQLVLLDLKMPGMDGVETAKRINAIAFDENESVHHRIRVPIIILVTAYGREQVQEQIGKGLMDTMLLKPVKPSELFNAIINLFGSDRNGSLRREPKTPGVYKIMNLSGRRVLLVEDSELNRDVALALLEDFGLSVEIAVNGKVAVVKVTSSQVGYYDAILMDIQMPEMDGYEATRHIREWEETDLHSIDNRGKVTVHGPAHGEDRISKTRIPIIALTAHAMKGEKQKCLDADMDDYLPKPIDENDLYRKLDKWIAS